MNYVFGPVPSRRLGQSLGIDTIPLKTCNWNCVYCQLGRTRPLTNERREYVPCRDILIELEQALRIHHAGEIDWVTFVGSGEPTLHNGLGWLIRQVKRLTELPVAVITNGALLYQPEVRTELSAADAVLPSLDAGTPDLYRKINRPWPKLTFQRLVDGLGVFRREFTGKLWVEVMLIKDVNDTETALKELSSVVDRIRPDQVHLSLPTRPPAESWVQPAQEEGLQRARAILGQLARVLVPPQAKSEFIETEDLEATLLSIITRHPMPEADLMAGLPAWQPEQVKAALTRLEVRGRAQRVKRFGTWFWSVAKAFYAKDGLPVSH
ncbi:MAG: radical SAM protein [Anaerolineales bacterium]|nr:radical SAM protein [Anaerolineales bacterium]